jgi:hypothetical protein
MAFPWTLDEVRSTPRRLREHWTKVAAKRLNFELRTGRAE